MTNKLWSAKEVADHFQEAVETLRKLPSVSIQGYFTLWPDMKQAPAEIQQMEPLPVRLRATPGAISRLEQTAEWMHWIDIQERKLIWKRAARVPWKLICRELGCDRSTAWRKWVIACEKIAVVLNAAAS